MTLATGGSKTRELATTLELATSLELATYLELANMFLLVLTFAARGSAFLGAIEIDARADWCEVGAANLRVRVGSAPQCRAMSVEEFQICLDGEVSSK